VQSAALNNDLVQQQRAVWGAPEQAPPQVLPRRDPPPPQGVEAMTLAIVAVVCDARLLLSHLASAPASGARGATTQTRPRPRICARGALRVPRLCACLSRELDLPTQPPRSNSKTKLRATHVSGTRPRARLPLTRVCLCVFAWCYMCSCASAGVRCACAWPCVVWGRMLCVGACVCVCVCVCVWMCSCAGVWMCGRCRRR